MQKIPKERRRRDTPATLLEADGGVFSDVLSVRELGTDGRREEGDRARETFVKTLESR